MYKFKLIVLLFLLGYTANSQVLYNETFNSYATGNVGTDVTGTIPGKGGWLTQCYGPGLHSNDLFKIISEPNRGNTLSISTETLPLKDVSVTATKIGIESLIDQRTAGNNVLKFEIDYNAGEQHTPGGTYGHSIALGYDENYAINNSTMLFIYSFSPILSSINVRIKDHIGSTFLDKNSQIATLPYNTWFTLIVYLDYNNKKAYFETPYFNTIAVADFLKLKTTTNLIEDFKPTTISLQFNSSYQNTTTGKLNKYDNIKITALKSVPAYVLSTENFLDNKFNVFPNPAESVVNITNADNLYVESVTIYDISGKEIKKQVFANESNIQLNVENLTSGAYMLHLQTNEGTAVKKLIKK